MFTNDLETSRCSCVLQTVHQLLIDLALLPESHFRWIFSQKMIRIEIDLFPSLDFAAVVAALVAALVAMEAMQ